MKGIIVDNSILNVRLLSHYVTVLKWGSNCVVELEWFDRFQVEVHGKKSKVDLVTWFVLGLIALNQKSTTWIYVQRGC